MKKSGATSVGGDLVQFLKGVLRHGLENTGNFYSLYRGVVVENEDPESLQRLKLIIPQISGNDSYDYWAHPRNVFYGEGYGMQILPKRGDIVWVEFEGGRPEIPVWSLGHPGRKELPTGDDDLKRVDCFWFVSPGGHKVKIDDTKNIIHIETKQGDYFEINEESISLVKKEIKNISLGKLNKSQYKAVLGEKIEDAMKDMAKYMTDFDTALNASLTASSGQFLAKAALQAAAPGLTQLASGLQEKIGQILSELVTLEK